MKQPDKELLDLLEHAAWRFEDAMNRIVRAHAGGKSIDVRDEVALADQLWQSMTLTDLLGRKRLLMEADAAAGKVPLALRQQVVFAATPVIPNVPFREAIEDIVRREPRLAKTAVEVSNLYRTRHAFALARAASLKITEAVQAAIKRLGLKGMTVPKASAVVADVGGFTRAYSETVYRTNVATAYSAGRYAEARSPGVAATMGAFERTAVGDSDTRPTHLAADGLLAGIEDPVWEHASVPSGYNCRCAQRLVSKYELERMGLLDRSGKVIRRTPAGFGAYRPDPGFGGGRPDRRIYGR